MPKTIKAAFLTAAAAILLTGTPEYSAAGEPYDPANTMSALNMAIVSVHRIISAEDRIVLDAEYKNIINNLKFGNIEDDPELRELYKELMDVIGGKALRRGEYERFIGRYDSREKNRFAGMLVSARGSFANPWSFIGGLLAGGVTSYFAAGSADGVREELEDELRKLERQNIEECAGLQKRLLDSSWTLLRRYSLPDEYRLTQSDLDDLGRAVSEPDRSKSVRMFRALEPHFEVYAPFWYYYGSAAQESKDANLARRCFDQFEKVWRPVLRQDPFRAEAAKYRAAALSDAGAPASQIIAQLNVVMENTPRENWMNNLYAGVMYYSAGEREKGMECVSLNLDFDVEREISETVLRSMEEGTLDPGTFADDVQPTLIAPLRGAAAAPGVTPEAAERGLIAWFRDDKVTAARLLSSAISGGASRDPVPYHAVLNMMETAEDVRSFFQDPPNAARLRGERDALAASAPKIAYEALLPIVERYAASGSTQAGIFLGDMYLKGLGVSKDVSEAARLFSKPAETGAAYAQAALGEIYSAEAGVKDEAKAAGYYRAAADQGLALAQVRLGDMYRDGSGVERNLEDAYMWYYLASLNKDPSAQSRLDDLDGRGLFKGREVSGATARRAKERARKIYEAAQEHK
ncbi:MAG: sel1 repeat family protein [Synergistaceae bacterium]|jgi:hypothetical protein|nr:sel1 repeat family protein [Synergistaceae bacterium]